MYSMVLCVQHGTVHTQSMNDMYKTKYTPVSHTNKIIIQYMYMHSNNSVTGINNHRKIVTRQLLH